ncbi:LOW QUALITY PROTEIN: endoribonuclease Dcr-1 [Aphomia sociella]
MEAGCSRFTAAEGGARLAAAAVERNILVVEYTAFISTRLLYEDAYKIRGKLSEGRKRSVQVTRSSRVNCVAYDYRTLTDLKLTAAHVHNDVLDWREAVEVNEVIVCTSEVLKYLLEERILTMKDLNILIIDSCHLIYKDNNLKYILKQYKESEQDNRPRILALTYPLFNAMKSEADNQTKDNKINAEESTETPNTESSSELDEVKLPIENKDSKIETNNDDNTLSIDNEELKSNVLETANENDVTKPKSETEIAIDNNEVDLISKDKKSSDADELDAAVSKSDDLATNTIEIDDETMNKASTDESVDKNLKTGTSSGKEEEEIGAYRNFDDFHMYEQLEWKIEELEKQLCCQMDLAEDIDGGRENPIQRRPTQWFKLSVTQTKLLELIVEHSPRPSPSDLPGPYVELEMFMRNTIDDAMAFLHEHRYDLTEIYGEDMHDDFKDIPDPGIVPKQLFRQFLYILDQLGPYSADIAAFSLLMKLETLCIKTPFERHFLLLRLCTTVFVKIRCHADHAFSTCTSDWDKIKNFSTPKVLRLVEILEKFQPENNLDNVNRKDRKAECTAKLLREIDKCDFVTLSNKIEDSVNTIESNLKEIVIENCDDGDIGAINKIDAVESDAVNKPDSAAVNNVDIAAVNKVDSAAVNKVDSAAVNEVDSAAVNKVDSAAVNKVDSAAVKKLDSAGSAINVLDSSENFSNSAVNSVGSGKNSESLWPSRRTGPRSREGRPARNNAGRSQQQQQNPDALCGVMFMNEPLMAKILFYLIVDMSRCNQSLSYLRAQYCAAGDAAHPRDCQRQGKKQEDVLKKFRMHECNLLLATSALEEGIDLPRCNLVLRWDIPSSYRSHGACRGRARAVRATSAVLSSRPSCSRALRHLAAYRELDQIISRKCGCGIQDEPPQSEEDHADSFTYLVKPYAPQDKYEKVKIQTDNKNVKISTSVEIQQVVLNKKDLAQNQQNTILNETNMEKLNFSVDSEINDDIRSNMVTETEHDKGLVEIEPDIESDSNINKTNIIENCAEMKSGDKLNIKKIDETLSKNGVIGKKVINKINDIPNGYINESNVLNNKCKERNRNTNDVDNDDNVESNLANKNLTNKNSDTKNDSFDSLSENEISENRLDSGNKVSAGTSECVSSDRNRRDVVNRSDIGVNKCDTKNVKIPDSDVASVDLSTAIPLINRYCAKLPSDTFTRLAPQWWIEEVQLPVQGSVETKKAYICTLRLPLNCPVKYNIVGHPMPTRVLARRMVALQACRILHKSGELDNQLMPIGKENFKATELESTVGCPGDNSDQNDAARPGTTKRRQYYYKRTAWAFTDCQPVLDTSDSDIDTPGSDIHTEYKIEEKKDGKRNMLYAIVSKLWCALPERYNTRGRRLHAPQHARQALGILMAREHPDSLQIPSFPVYTRSGEVRVSVKHVPRADTRLSPRRARLVRRFMRFVFAEVLRVQRRGMRLAADGGAHNNYYIVPTIKLTKEDGSTQIDIDWAFLELIYKHTELKEQAEIEKPMLFPDKERDSNEKEKKEGEKGKKMDNPLLKDGEVFQFDQERYKEAVVTPWYRNQDQPQFFLVAEICWNLNPDSAFPSATHASFRNYYNSKYGVTLTQSEQPLLDVDHTSARLNLLTPRYVNRKGVALPVSSERTRRAKRDRLDQKQILVPELCRVHPFAAPLWFATVALPCVLYRINALLIADEIRRAVAIDVGLGIPKIDDTKYPAFQWPPLDFGWSLAEVLNADSEKTEKKKDDEDTIKKEEINTEETSEIPKEESTEEEPKEKTVNDILQEKEDAESTFEIGMWSNEMASNIQTTMYNEYLEPLPSNLTLCTSASGGVDWTERSKGQFNPTRPLSVADSDCSYMSSEFDTDDTDSDVSEDNESSFISPMSFRIEYKTPHEAEAVDVERKKVNPAPLPDAEDDAADRAVHDALVRTGNAPEEYIEKFRQSVASHEKDIVEKGFLIKHDEPVKHILPEGDTQKTINTGQRDYAKLLQMFPYNPDIINSDGQIDIEIVEKNKRLLLAELKRSLPADEIKKLKCFSMADVNIDSSGYVNEKIVNVGFDTKDNYVEKISKWDAEEFKPYFEEGKAQSGKSFDFDYQPKLEGHPGPSPSVILQALTMSNANDGINLERLETIGDSFLKFAITAYLYCAHPTVHEGKLSHMRSKQVSNLNLYRLGRCRRLGARMIASKFEPHDNWLPPCHRPPPTLQPRHNQYFYATQLFFIQGETQEQAVPDSPFEASGCFIPYNLITQHSIPDKSIADCVEALIGAYLLECGPRGALLFMSWLGIKVLPRHELPLPHHPYVVASQRETPTEQKPTPQPSPKRSYDSADSDTELSSEDESEQHQEKELVPEDWSWPGRPVGSLRPYKDQEGRWMQSIFGELKAPPSPLLRYIEDPEGELEQMLSGYDALERTLQYRFKDRSLLLQALTHASHNSNRLTDCYQRLEFLGDAILDYLITRHLYEDARRHSPGALTDLRSALVNNTIFAALAARHSFHK